MRKPVTTWMIFRCPGCNRVKRWGTWFNLEESPRMKVDVEANRMHIEWIETQPCPACGGAAQRNLRHE